MRFPPFPRLFQVDKKLSSIGERKGERRRKALSEEVSGHTSYHNTSQWRPELVRIELVRHLVRTPCLSNL